MTREVPERLTKLHESGRNRSKHLETGFLHSHKSHEELYFFLSGKGEFQVDGTVFPVEEGSVVRVSPAGKRSVRNNGTTPLLMLCIQYCSNTFSQEDATDGIILKEPVKWKVSPK